jgi:hypothetical protein
MFEETVGRLMRIASGAAALIGILCLNAGCVTPWIWELGKSYKEGEPIIIDGAELTEQQLVLAYHAKDPAIQSEKEQEGVPKHWATIELTDLTKDPRPVSYVYPKYSYPTTDPLSSNAVIQAKVTIVPAFDAEGKEGCVEEGTQEGRLSDNCLVFRKQLLCHKDKLDGALVFRDSSGLTRRKELEIPTPGQEFRKPWAYPVAVLLTPIGVIGDWIGFLLVYQWAPQVIALPCPFRQKAAS